MKTAFIFPGQGAQTVGMGSDVAEAVPAAAALFARANNVVGYDLSKLCFEGPPEQLNSTVVSQPAIFVTSAALLEAVRTDAATTSISADATAGLSLGEYTALYAAGRISFEDALVLVQKRGQAMQRAADASEGGMVSIIGLDEEKVRRLCDQAGHGELLVPVNFNCPGQIVVSGTRAACERAEQTASEFGAIKAVRLEVAAAFHTEMMSDAADALATALQACTVSETSTCKVVANISAEYYDSPAEIREGLTRQLVRPILWQRCMERLLADGVEDFYEIGPNRVLTGLMRRIDRKTRVTNLSALEAIRTLQHRQTAEAGRQRP